MLLQWANHTSAASSLKPAGAKLPLGPQAHPPAWPPSPSPPEAPRPHAPPCPGRPARVARECREVGHRRQGATKQSMHHFCSLLLVGTCYT